MISNNYFGNYYSGYLYCYADYKAEE